MSTSTPKFTVDPSYSPLYQPSVTRNALTLANLSTLTAMFAGIYAGVLGLKNQWGFVAYLGTAVVNALCVIAIKVVSRSNKSSTGLASLKRFVPQSRGSAVAAAAPGGPSPQAPTSAPPTATSVAAVTGRSTSSSIDALSLIKTIWILMAVGQENILTFLLFWIGVYAVIHVYD